MNRTGAVLIYVLAVITVMLGALAFVVDLGFVLITRDDGIKAAELCATRAVSEMYVPDYVDVQLPPDDDAGIPGLDPDQWWSQFKETVARDAAHDLGTQHAVGFVDPGVPYNPNIHVNADNFATGDILIGTWDKTPGGGFSFSIGGADVLTNNDLGRAMRVAVRRVATPENPDVSEGDNPTPVMFAKFLGVTQPSSNAMIVTVKLDPAAVIGAGAVVPMSDGNSSVTGSMPLALRRAGTVQRVRPVPVTNITVTDWIRASDPSWMVQVRVTRDGTAASGGGVPFAGTAYWVSYPSGLGGTSLERIERRLGFLGQLPSSTIPNPEAPPQVYLSRVLNGPGQGDGGSLSSPADINDLWDTFFSGANNRFINRTWIVPVVNESQETIGFTRVYCEDARLGGPDSDKYIELDLRLAPSCSSRNSGTMTSLSRLNPPISPPAAVVSAHYDLFWLTDGADNIRIGPLPFGVGCVPVTAEYRR
jgi:hypothetical protein